MPIVKPNTTQTPNIIFDELLPLMKEAELRVTLVIARKTFGWHKEEDELSLSQLQKLTGLGRQGVLNGIEDGMARGIIKRREKGQGFLYSLLVHEVDQNNQASPLSRLEVVHEVDQSLVHLVDTQKKVVKESIKSTSDLPEKLAPEPDEQTPKPRSRDLLFDAICTVCDLDPDHLPSDTKGSTVGKVKKNLVAAKWRAEDVLNYYAWRQSKSMGPLGSVHWLLDEMAKREWRNGSPQQQRQSVPNFSKGRNVA